MALLEFQNLSFTYAGSSKQILDGINLSVQKQEMVLITGDSGSGKTTLLKHAKKSMIPCGLRSGTVYYDRTEIALLETERSAAQIGYVGQNPEDQIVTDKVWHELAFGLENLGMPPSDIRKRTAETASYFGITDWYHKEVSVLSGGQKQLLNLAAVMVMRPSVLLLDEPTAQLDPIAAGRFIDTVFRLNREIGTTVLITEHRTEQLFALADRVVMLSQGKIVCDAPPREAAAQLTKEGRPMLFVPAALQIYAAAQKSLDRFSQDKIFSGKERFPLTVREGRFWLEKAASLKGMESADGQNTECTKQHFKDSRLAGRSVEKEKMQEELAVVLKAVRFRYERHGEDILENLNLTVQKGTFLGVLGANGAGKSTLLRLIASTRKCVGGSVQCIGRTAMVPQNPQALFTEISVEEELAEVMTDRSNSWAAALKLEEKRSAVEAMLTRMNLTEVRKNNPFDLSGGQQQKLALAKVLLCRPDILLLDEPTKGLDPQFKERLGLFLKALVQEENVTVVMVSHDVEFCAQYTQRCAMIFDRTVISVDETAHFFAGNQYYTTAANRIAGGIYPDCVTCEQVVKRLTEEC